MLCSAKRDMPAALESYRTALAIGERAAKTDPKNGRWQRNLAISHTKIGDVLLKESKFPDALTSYETAEAIL